MAGFGRFILFDHFSKFLYPGSNFLTFNQNLSNIILKDVPKVKPKKPETAFLLYLRNVRQRILSENPSMKVQDMIKKASVEWANIDATEKKNLQNEYKKNYEIYVQQMKEFQDSLPDNRKESGKLERETSIRRSSAKKVAFGKPKKPINPFLMYLLARKNDREPNMSYKVWVKIMSENWKNLLEEEKQPYYIQCETLKKQYYNDMTKWEKEMINLGHTDIVRQQTVVDKRED